MKSYRLFIAIILFISTVACADNKGNDNEDKGNQQPPPSANAPVAIDTFEKGKVISPVFCRSDPNQSYALYIPTGINSGTLPAIYLFDPHGNGSLPLNKYKAIAERYGFILVGSNNSKNGNDWPTTEIIWSSMFDDSRRRLPVNVNRVYACGFSGGAKCATYIGLNHNEVKSVIANGAGLPDIVHTIFPFSFTGIAGEGDMNMTDLVAINSELNKTKSRHRLILFNGKHEWAPEAAMDLAFAGLQFDAMYTRAIPMDTVFIRKFANDHQGSIDALIGKNHYLEAEEDCDLCTRYLDGLTKDVEWFKAMDASLKEKPAYQKQWEAKQSLLAKEQEMKAMFNRQFQEGDINSWTNLIKGLQNSARSATPEGAMYQRLVAYLSLAFYSISNQMLNSSRNDEAGHFIELYKMVDPTNGEAWYFSAQLNARKSNVKGTEEDLLKAIANGFADSGRMLQQSEFKNLQIDFSRLAAKMRETHSR